MKLNRITCVGQDNFYSFALVTREIILVTLKIKFIFPSILYSISNHLTCDSGHLIQLNRFFKTNIFYLINILLTLGFSRIPDS